MDVDKIWAAAFSEDYLSRRRQSINLRHGISVGESKHMAEQSKKIADEVVQAYLLATDQHLLSPSMVNDA